VHSDISGSLRGESVRSRISVALCCFDRLRKELCAFSLALLWFIALATVIQRSFGIFYETNDDVGMMMLAHGFGLASHPTDLLLYSSRVQGFLISLLGWPFGLPGYSLYLFTCLLLSAAAMVAGLARLNGRFPVDLLLVSALVLRPMFAPQFTIVASFLAIAAATSLLCFEQLRRPGELIVGAMFGFLAFLMRVDALGFIALLSAPMALRMSIVRSRPALVVGSVVMILMLAASWWSAEGYDTPAWAPYRAMDPLRAWFTDYGMGRALLASPVLLHRVGWSANDVRMIENWWFFDPAVYSVAKLREVVSTLGVASTFSFTGARALLAFRQFLRPSMAPAVVLLMVSLFFVTPGKRLRIFGAVLALLAATLVITMAGRFNVTRVFYPGVCLVIVFACSQLSRAAAISLMLAAFAASASTFAHYVPHASAMEDGRRKALAALASSSAHPVLMDWAGALPYQELYPAFELRGEVPPLEIYSIGADQLAPYALARWGGDPERVVAQFTSPEGVSIVANGRLMRMLAVYCAQHWAGRLDILSKTRLGYGTLYRAVCRAGTGFGGP
jgi:hypothetical protein